MTVFGERQRRGGIVPDSGVALPDMSVRCSIIRDSERTKTMDSVVYSSARLRAIATRYARVHAHIHTHTHTAYMYITLKATLPFCQFPLFQPCRLTTPPFHYSNSEFQSLSGWRAGLVCRMSRDRTSPIRMISARGHVHRHTRTRSFTKTQTHAPHACTHTRAHSHTQCVLATGKAFGRKM